MKTKIEIIKALPEHEECIWEIIEEVIKGGDTYVFSPNSTRSEMIGYWCGVDKYTYVALLDNKVLGTFILKDNYPGLASHIANGSYMTSPKAFGIGIGSAMAEFSIVEAKRLGYKAMQFNIVVKTNERAVRLWQKMGFEIKGEIPEAFNHKEKGLVNAYIMWKKL